ncbi:MAG: LytTR family DNA-binding domain-containing protein [Coprobacillus sp.]
MIKIGICDDNQTLLKKYVSMIDEICKDGRLGAIEIHTFTNGESLLEVFSKDRESMDILFLDILMEPLDGVETARRLMELHSKAVVIFLTSSEEYVFESMDVKPLSYVMKNQATNEVLEKVLRDALYRVKQNSQVIEFSKDGDIYSLTYSDICFIKVYKGFCYVHHWDGIIFESRDLSIVEKLKNNFFRVHEQYFVNLQYLGKIEKEEVVLSDKSSNVIPLNPKYSQKLKIQFAEYMMEKM